MLQVSDRSVLFLSMFVELILRHLFFTVGAETEETLAVSFVHGKVRLHHLFIAEYLKK